MSDCQIKILVMSTNGVLKDGITSWLIATFGAMDLDGFSVSTLAFEGADPKLLEDINAIGIEVLTLPSRQDDPFAYSRSFKLLLRQRQFDIIHICCNSSLVCYELLEAKKACVKMRIAHSRNTMCSHRIINFLLKPFFESTLTDRYACGHDAGRWLFGDRPFTIIPNGKELSNYSFSKNERLDMRSVLGIGSDDVVFGHVGSFNDQKNHNKLVAIFAEVLSRLPNAVLLLIGEGHLMTTVAARAESAGIADHVRFLGCRDDVPRLLNAMDCMIFPSLYEGFPNVVLEWQLNGLPVVMSNTITDECIITPLVSQVSLDASAGTWADAVDSIMRRRDREWDSRCAQVAARSAGYDIHENADLLRHLYLEGAA